MSFNLPKLLREEPQFKNKGGVSRKKYLSIEERLKLIKEIQKGIYLVENKQGRIQQKKDLTPFTDECDTLEILEKLADVSELGGGSYGKAYKVCTPKNVCEQIDAFRRKTLSYSIKEVEFLDYATYNSTINNPDRYENSEIRMLQFLSSFVTQHATPHINLPIMSWVCVPSPKLHPFIGQKELPKRYIVSELADYGDCLGFLALHFKKWYRRPIIWKVIFFQILHTFAVIHKYFPNFIHNDFKPDNILVRSTTNVFINKIGSLIANEDYDFKNYYQYNFNGDKYYVPDVGFQLLIWDFDFASICSKIENDKVLLMIDEGANLNVHKNKYYDIAMCFNLFVHYFGDSFPDEISDWIYDEVINRDIETSNDERILEAIEYTTPTKLLQSSFFDELKRTVSSHKIKENYLGEVNKRFEFSGPPHLRYELPDECEYGEFTFIVPKIISKIDKENLKYRLNCRKSTDDDINLFVTENLKDKIKYWMEYILSLDDISSRVRSKHIQEILDSSYLYFEEFLKHYHVSSDVLYGIAACSIMYSSYVVLLSYTYPFSVYSWWVKQAKLREYNQNKFIDVYKQFCIFVAKYIE